MHGLRANKIHGPRSVRGRIGFRMKKSLPLTLLLSQSRPGVSREGRAEFLFSRRKSLEPGGDDHGYAASVWALAGVAERGELRR